MLQFNKCIFSYAINCVDGDIIFRSKENAINSLNGRVFPSLPMEVKSFHFGKINNWYWADNCNGQIYFVESLTNEIIYQNKREEFGVTIGWEPVFIDDSRILVSRGFGEQKIISILNLKDFSFVDVLYQGNYGYSEYNLVVDRVWDSDRRIDFLIAYDTSSGVEKWRYSNFREYKALLSGEIKTESVDSIFAVVGDSLWLLLNTGRIVGLNPVTGECKKSIEVDDVDLTYFDNAESEFRSAAGYNAIFIENEAKVISLYESIYFEIDLTADKPARVCYNVKQSFKDKDLDSVGHRCINSRYVFFNETGKGTLGAFDRQTKKVVWVDKLKNHKPDAGAVRELKATEDQLYVHDNKQNLFVFDLT